MKVLAVLVALVMLISNIPANVIAETGFPQQVVTVDQALEDEMKVNGTATYWVEFENTADLSQAYFMDWGERGWFVYRTLKAQADETQAVTKARLDKADVEYQSFWISNRILVKQSSQSIFINIQHLPFVKAITAVNQYILYEPEQVESTETVNAIEPNIAHVLAPEAWALGFDGTGMVVANIDTGVRYTHDALKNAYRGNDGAGNYSHDYNWFDPYGTYSSPADGNGHGTHTMGTMVGNDGGLNQIGIAPGAEWVACRGCNTNTCGDDELLTCAQFIAAPTKSDGTDADPEVRPNVVNNSWGDCGLVYDDWYADVIDVWHAAGVYPVFSNGNASNCTYPAPPGLNTVGNPARAGNVTGVGSSGTSNGQYAAHSNWGPTDDLDTINPVNGFAMLKPQVIAPGVWIRSSTPSKDTSYSVSTGTSMSAPHVSGLVALIMQAGPCLVGNYAVVEYIIESTATHIIYDDGSPLTPTNYPNFATGWGEINALAAVQVAANACGNSVLTGLVTSETANPISGAKVDITGTDQANNRTVFTNAAGIYTANVNADTFDMVASAFGYEDDTAEDIVVADGATVEQDFVLKFYFLQYLPAILRELPITTGN